MSNQRFDYVDQELSRTIENFIKRADSIDTNTINLLNAVKHFLKTDQYKIVVQEPSVTGAEKQMKGVASFFNEKRDLLEGMGKQIIAFEDELTQFIQKLNNNGHTSKATKLTDALQVVIDHKGPITDLTTQLQLAKKLQLNGLKNKILKTERVRHFKHLH